MRTSPRSLAPWLVYRRTWRNVSPAAAFLLALLLVPFATARGVYAQAQPPNRFFGTAKVNDKEQPEGTVIEAYIGKTLCGSGTVQNRNGNEVYLVDVLGAGQKSGCAKDGDKVTFKIDNLDAKETGTYTTAAATRLDLTASGNARQIAQPTVLAPGTGGTPAPSPTFTPAPTQPPAPATAPAATATPPPGETPAPAETPTAAASVAPTATAAPTETPALTPAATAPAPVRKSSRPPIALWVVVVLAILAIGAGLAAWAYQRRNIP